MNEKELKRKMAQYCAWRGYSTNLIVLTKEGLYAHVNGWVSKDCKYFTQILQGGTTVRLSLKDLENELIVGDFKFE